MGISRRLWTAGAAHDLHKVGIPPVIHFSTASSLHNYPVADQHVYLNHPQAYTQDVSLAGPGAGLIGACSHAGPGSYTADPPHAIVAVTVAVGAHHLERAAQIVDLVDLTRTQPRNLESAWGQQPLTTSSRTAE